MSSWLELKEEQQGEELLKEIHTKKILETSF